MLKGLFFSLLFLLGFIAFAQDDVKWDKNSEIERVDIPKKNIDNYRNRSEFNYVVNQKTNIIKRIWNWIKRILTEITLKLLEYLFGIKTAGKIFVFIIKTLPYVAILLFTYLIFKYLLGVDLVKIRNKQQAKFPGVEISDEEKILKEENIETLIKQAVSQKNYRLATRYYYLLVLKYLIDKNLLEWKPEKTNRDYVLEMKKYNFSSLFKNLTFIYDYVWYGNFAPDEDEFKRIENEFIYFKTQTK